MTQGSRLPMDVRTISPELLKVTFPEGIDLILANPPVLATHLSSSNIDHAPPGLDQCWTEYLKFSPDFSLKLGI